MKTDALFYELFRLDPHSLFQLVKLNVIGQYVFESITVKTTEKRFDGFFRRKDGRGPYIFLEVQGYYDAVIYWRFFREICAWYEQKGSSTPFAAVVLFLDGDYDPGECPLLCAPPNQLIRKNLADCLNAAKGRSGGSGVLTVLEPLVLSHKKELPAKVSEWTAEIRSAELPENKT
ncbi:MAG: DUF2887 domain-containing protein, partial [Desulfobacterales bacterium]|nr:DUF2887 domain-containing protein [Desulfobacterales bacterium]